MHLHIIQVCQIGQSRSYPQSQQDTIEGNINAMLLSMSASTASIDKESSNKQTSQPSKVNKNSINVCYNFLNIYNQTETAQQPRKLKEKLSN